MNKKGFTLIEIAISIGLLSVVMIFMFRLLINLRDSENNISDETEKILTKTTVSKVLNGYVKSGGGISSASCTTNKCDIVLKDNSNMELSLSGSILTYKDTDSDTLLLKKSLIKTDTYTLELINHNNLHIIKIVNSNNPEYNIEIVNYDRSE